MTKSSTCTLPHDAFPHIIDAIFAASSPNALLNLRAASRGWRERADALLCQHVRFDGDTFRIPTSRDSLRVPVAHWLDEAALTAAVRVLDITPLPPGSGSQPVRLAPASCFRGLRTARIGRVLDYWEHGLFEVDTVVLPSPTTRVVGEGLRAGHFDFLRKQVRRRIVVHVPHRWPERLFTDLGVMLKFGRATELVLVFPDAPKLDLSPTSSVPAVDDDDGGGYGLGLAIGRGFADETTLAAASDAFTAIDVMWPHFGVKGKLACIDLVNTGRGLADWAPSQIIGKEETSPKLALAQPTSTAPEPSQRFPCSGTSRRHTEWRVWRRFELNGHRAPDEVQHWTPEEVMDRAHSILRFMSLNEYRADVGHDTYRIEMGQ